MGCLSILPNKSVNAANNQNFQAQNKPYQNVSKKIKKKYYDCYSKPERAAKNWIAWHESGYNYKAVNGTHYGRFHTWIGAKKFWENHGSYMVPPQGQLTNFSKAKKSKTVTHLPKRSERSKFWSKFKTVRVKKRIKVYKIKARPFVYEESPVKTKILKPGTKIKVRFGGATWDWILKEKGIRFSKKSWWVSFNGSTKWMKPYKARK